jgi:hypothetical protein
MLTHVVFFKLKERIPENIGELVARLAPLAERVPQVRHLEVGADVVRAARSYDVALIVKFDDRAAMEAYQVHPEHVPVADYVREVCESILAVDFEETVS